MKAKSKLLLHFLLLLSHLPCWAQSWQEFATITEYYYQQGELDIAIEYAEKTLAQAEKEFGENHQYYTASLNVLSLIYETAGEFEKATELCLQVADNVKSDFGPNSPEYAFQLNILGNLYRYQKDYSKALHYFVEALDISKNTLGTNHIQYGQILINIGHFYQEQNKLEEAIRYFESGIGLIENHYGKETEPYQEILFSLAMAHQELKHLETSNRMFEELLELTDVENTSVHIDYLYILTNNYTDLGNFNKAIYYATKRIEISEISLSDGKPDLLRVYFQSMDLIAETYTLAEDYNKAIELYNEILNKFESIYGKDNEHYGVILNKIGFLYYKVGEFDHALHFLSEGLANRGKIFGKEHPHYGTSLNNLAFVYQDMGQYDKAISLMLESLENVEKNFGKEHPDYGVGLNNLALLYRDIGELDQAISLLLESVENPGKTENQESLSYCTSLNNLGLLYGLSGQYEKAITFLLDALESMQKIMKEDHSIYGTILGNLGGFYMELGQYEKSLLFLNKALENSDRIFADNHPVKIDVLFNLGTLYHVIEQYQKAYSQYQQAIKIQLNYLHKSYALLSEQEKEKLNRTILGKFTGFHGFTYHARHEVPEAIEEDLLVALATSGLLLNSSKQMREAVLQSGDTALLNRYDNWMLVNKQVDLAAGLTLDERKNRGLDLVALQSKANDIERALVQQSAGLLDIPDYTIGKAEVSRALSKGEAAVQFNSFAYRNPKAWTDSVLYVAYIITPGGGLQYIPLFEERQLLSLVKSLAEPDGKPVVGRQTLEQLHDLVWKPLLPYLQGVSTVYYAPSGLLNKVPFAMVSSAGIETPAYAFELRCLFSVRDLPTLKQKEMPVAAGGLLALFGGADFDYLDKSAKEQEPFDIMFAPLAQIPDSLRGSSWGYLEGSLKEVKQINAIAAKSGLKTVQYTGTDASKAHLVSMVKEKKPTVLHIATHGFYFSTPKREPKPEPAFAMLGYEQHFRRAENPLLRSGLLLAGANQKWKHNKNTEAENDGILTAQEISRMDLSNTQLLVLSACETGLGDIRHSEGVYGMQRAFRIAGAKKLLVSLWQVPDLATAVMMELFYTALLQKKQSAHQAFRHAQNTMRQKYSDDPVKWAGFVLVE